MQRGLKSRIPIRGKLKLYLYDEHFQLLEYREYTNTITETHDALVADRMAGGSDDLIRYTGIGTASGGKDTSSTALQSQLARVANQSNTQQSGENDNDVFHAVYFVPGVGTGALVEAGAFSDAAGATLRAWQDFAVVNKGASETLRIEWTFVYGAS